MKSLKKINWLDDVYDLIEFKTVVGNWNNVNIES